MRIDRLDHLVLFVTDIDTTIDFYTRVLRMEAVTFGGGRRALRFGRTKINLHPVDRVPEQHPTRPAPGSGDFCLITDAPPGEVVAHLADCGVEVLEGPSPRTGATGPITSVYFYDPDGNLVEVASYGS